jgi:predicted metal-dependent hydrolase
MSGGAQMVLDWGDGAGPNSPLGADPAAHASPVVGGVEAHIHPQANRELRLGAVQVAYLLTRARRRSIGLRIAPQGLEVRAPRHALVAEIVAAIEQRADWVINHLRRQRVRQEQQAQARIVWAPGGIVPYLGQPLRLQLAPAGTAPQHVHWDGVLPGQLLLSLPPQADAAQWRDAVFAWLQRQALSHFQARLSHYAPLLGVQWQQLKLSSAQSRWGSADARGVIRLNWRLMHAPPELIDYVVVHELSHLREMNHSPKFWAVVAQAMPDYAQRVRDLHAWAAPPW